MRESLRLVIVLGLIATISGGVLAYVHQTMSPIIEENKAAAMGEAILEVLPGAVSYEVVTVGPGADATSSGSTEDATTSGSTVDGTSSSSLTDTTSSGSTSDTTGGGIVADTTSGSSLDTITSSSLTDATTSGSLTDATTSGSVSDGTSGSSVADATSGGSDATTGSSVADGTSGGSVDGTGSSSLADGTSGSSVDGTSGSSVVVNIVTTYRGMDANGNTTGIAFAVDGNGFGGTIRLMVGFDPTSRKLNRVKVLDHLETPGLGARITEQAFLRQFEAKSLDDTFTAKQDVDAITGATVSSQAVAATIRNALSEVEANLRVGGIW
jgi:Na+-translocating ferredoxin:NAD+ oxidoreductase RnfG subunit